MSMDSVAVGPRGAMITKVGLMKVGGTASGEITSLLEAWSDGDEEARSHLFEIVYRELRAMAGRVLGGEGDQTLQPTALVHELYLRLVRQRQVSWRNRVHLYSLSATIMRRIAIDHARRRKRRAAEESAKTMILGADGEVGPVVDALALHLTLERLATFDPIKARLVELRFFAGMTVPEAAEVMDTSVPTANRHWRLARAWLFAQLESEAGEG